MTSGEPTPAMQNPEKDPEESTTGEEPMTGPQRSYLRTLCREAAHLDDLSKVRIARVERSGDISFIKKER